MHLHACRAARACMPGCLQHHEVLRGLVLLLQAPQAYLWGVLGM